MQVNHCDYTHTCPSERLPPLHCVCHNQRRVRLLPRSLGYTCRENGKHRWRHEYISTTGASTRASAQILRQAWFCSITPSLSTLRQSWMTRVTGRQGEDEVEKKPMFSLYRSNHSINKTQKMLFFYPIEKTFKLQGNFLEGKDHLCISTIVVRSVVVWLSQKACKRSLNFLGNGPDTPFSVNK